MNEPPSSEAEGARLATLFNLCFDKSNFQKWILSGRKVTLIVCETACKIHTTVMPDTYKWFSLQDTTLEVMVLQCAGSRVDNSEMMISVLCRMEVQKPSRLKVHFEIAKKCYY
ncbi:hypothetical protein KIL84_012808 [Mauremys mutica]|uniref:Uncharacterized protein n=1 Tax=Mauremys mutica TaxID=74926 RepID=A0A9D3XRT9_9SAUR|nr:hypothetical protein KIL84_012808 [Mauremys mutica]